MESILPHNLTQVDVENLRRCFITPELIAAAGLRRVDDTEGAAMVGRERKAGTEYAGIAIPYFIPPDYNGPREYRLRRDQPDLERIGKGELKEKQKTLSPPGRGNMIYFPPGVTQDDLANTALPCVITEGEKKTLALYRLKSEGSDGLRFMPIGISGVRNWRGTVGKTSSSNGSRVDVKGVIADFDLISWQGRNVTILFDTNVHTNQDVWWARQGLARELASRGANVLFAELPKDCGVNGIDDYLGKIEQEEGLDAAINAGLQILDAATNSKRLKRLKTRRLSDVTALPVTWLWPPFLALGAFSLVDGIEGIGKTFLMLRIACAVAIGRGLPGVSDEQHIGPANVLLISAEDSLPFVIKPRLEAMGAPCERIIAVEESFTLDEDGILRLSQVIAEYDPKLVIIDPLFSRVGGVNLNTDNEIRSITDPLNRLAEKYDCAVVGIRHVNKSKGFGDPRNAGLNGVGWRAGCRSNLLVGVDPKDASNKAICQTKNNLAPIYEGSLGFKIADGVCEWTGPSDLTAEAMLAFKENISIEDRGAKKEAMEFLSSQLAGGPRKSTDILFDAKSAGISEITLRRAKATLKITPTKGEFAGQWIWELPKPEDDQSNEDDHEDAQSKENDHLRVNSANKHSYKHNLPEDDHPVDTKHLHPVNGRPYVRCGNCEKHKYVDQDRCPYCGEAAAVRNEVNI